MNNKIIFLILIFILSIILLTVLFFLKNKQGKNQKEKYYNDNDTEFEIKDREGNVLNVEALFISSLENIFQNIFPRLTLTSLIQLSGINPQIKDLVNRYLTHQVGTLIERDDITDPLSFFNFGFIISPNDNQLEALEVIFNKYREGMAKIVNITGKNILVLDLSLLGENDSLSFVNRPIDPFRILSREIIDAIKSRDKNKMFIFSIDRNKIITDGGIPLDGFIFWQRDGHYDRDIEDYFELIGQYGAGENIPYVGDNYAAVNLDVIYYDANSAYELIFNHN